MAERSQYLTFALIADSAFIAQVDYVNSQVAEGCKVDDSCFSLLYIAKQVITSIISYGKWCSVSTTSEGDIITATDWLMKNLQFSIETDISMLPKYFGFDPDFNQDDFNSNDFA